jgi:hypothetical protein
MIGDVLSTEAVDDFEAKPTNANANADTVQSQWLHGIF